MFINLWPSRQWLFWGLGLHSLFLVALVLVTPHPDQSQNDAQTMELRLDP